MRNEKKEYPRISKRLNKVILLRLEALAIEYEGGKISKVIDKALSFVIKHPELVLGGRKEK